MIIGNHAGLKIGEATRDAFGDVLRALGEEFPDLVVVDGDVGDSTRTAKFGKAFPKRFFNMGIAESNMIGVAGGLAACGRKVVASSFAGFLLCNAFDQIRMTIAYPSLPVKLVGSHAGISIGEDGPSQMAVEDLALASVLPGFTVLAPADGPSAAKLTREMFEIDGPVFMRTGRPKVPVVYENTDELKTGRSFTLKEGNDAAVIACGLMSAAALDAAAILEEDGIHIRVLDMHTVKPLDESAVLAAARETGAVVTAEEHLLRGGMGEAVASVIAANHPVRMGFIGLNDCYAESGAPDDLLKKYGLTGVDIARKVRELLDGK